MCKEKKKCKSQGAAGIEPATAGSAIPCSTAELYTRGVKVTGRLVHSSLLCAILGQKWAITKKGYCRNRTGDRRICNPMLYR